MRESWRWFGPDDTVSLDDIRQTGATDIVSALHSIPAGDIWPTEAIYQYKSLIETTALGITPLKWSVVESIPVHEDIKLARPGNDQYVKNWIASMENLAQCGIKTICYNFMPVIDWTRTDLEFRLASGAYALRFDQEKFAAFDLFILQREEVEHDYSAKEIAAAKQTFEMMSELEKTKLTNNIIAGLPGGMTESYSLEDFRTRLDDYKDVTHEVLRSNLFNFLSQVLPRAEQLGVKLAIHPDDPPRDLLGLPRIICTAEDIEQLFTRLPCQANGITLCVGTYGSRPDNNLPEMVKQFGSRIHFAHLRGVSRDADEQRSFYEASHLESDIDMVHIIRELLIEEQKRQKITQSAEIFFRPDHGHKMMDDINKTVNPGYSCIGRLRGLAELRGVIKAITSSTEEN